MYVTEAAWCHEFLHWIIIDLQGILLVDGYFRYKISVSVGQKYVTFVHFCAWRMIFESSSTAFRITMLRIWYNEVQKFGLCFGCCSIVWYESYDQQLVST